MLRAAVRLPEPSIMYSQSLTRQQTSSKARIRRGKIQPIDALLVQKTERGVLTLTEQGETGAGNT